MRIANTSGGRSRAAAILAAGLLTASAATQASAMVSSPINNSAPAKPAPDAIVEDGDSGGDEGEAPAGPSPSASGQAFGYGDAVAATRDGLRRSAIGSGIRRLRMLDYILIGGVSLLLLLTIALLILVIGLRSRLATLTGNAARSPALDDEPIYGAKTLP